MNDPAGINADRRHVAAALAEHGRWLRTVLAARGVERAAIDDVLQEASSQALRNADQLRDRGKTAAWLYRIAVTQALLHRRRAGRRRKLADRFAESGLAAGEAADDDRSSSWFAGRWLSCRRATRRCCC
jgi:DNA-directed RNA polymerase specialized sigma24 family protein